jgi:sugar phosphate isomerase/epimerase
MAEFGARGHDFGRLAPEELAKSVHSAGLTHVQLAPSKALTGYPGDAAAYPAYARGVAAAFSAQGVRIAVLGCYVDPLLPDPAGRRAEIERYFKSIDLCDAYEAGMVATETGPRPGGAAEAAEFTRIAAGWAERAEAAGARIAIEPVFGHTVSGPRAAKRLLDDISSPALGIVYDPANLVDPARPGIQAATFALALELLGERIMAIHAKDFIIEGERKRSVPPGEGIMEWKAALAGFAGLPLKPPILIEDIRPAAIPEARAFLASLV